EPAVCSADRPELRLILGAAFRGSTLLRARRHRIRSAVSPGRGRHVGRGRAIAIGSAIPVGRTVTVGRIAIVGITVAIAVAVTVHVAVAAAVEAHIEIAGAIAQAIAPTITEAITEAIPGSASPPGSTPRSIPGAPGMCGVQGQRYAAYHRREGEHALQTLHIGTSDANPRRMTASETGGKF